MLNIEDRYEDINNPLIIQRSDIIRLNGINECLNSSSDLKIWKLYQIDSNGTILKTFGLENITNTWNKSDLVIQPNTLDYGLYKFIFEVTQYDNITAKIGNSSQIETYIKIVQTDLGIFGLPGGMSQVSIGSAQSIHLNPANYSLDYDFNSNLNKLKFNFSCRAIDSYSIIVDNTTNETVPYFVYYPWKNTSSIDFNPQTDCFSSISAYFKYILSILDLNFILFF